jgi:hypothetical protein
METKREHYNRIRNKITDGCLILIKKDQFISKAIRWFDNSEYSHIGVIFEKAGRLFIIDSNPNGVHPELLSERIKICSGFTIIKPLCDEEIINEALDDLFKRAEIGIKYDFSNGFKEALNRKFKLKLHIIDRDEHDICSDWVKNIAIDQNMLIDKFNDLKEPFPQDYIRYRNIKTTEIL